jgi:hypothetical protein
MPNPHLIQRLAAIQQSLLAHHMGGQGMPNSMAGGERETFLREFLQALFPAHRRFSSGAITDSEGKITGQVDIAVEYGVVPSFPTPGSDQRLLLAESVAIVLEVKSNLVAQWNQLCDTTQRIKVLRRNMNPILQIGQPLMPHIPTIAIGYQGHATLDGLRQRLLDTPEDRRPDGALVISSGCFVGLGVEAHGALGLYALCLAINEVIARLQLAAPDLLSYVREQGGGAT